MQPIVDKEYGKVALIYVHPSLTDQKKLRITAHEALHAAYPSLTEDQVVSGSRILCEAIWQAGFRKAKNRRRK